MHMTDRQAELSPGRTHLVLATLFLGVFVLGSGELLVVGVLDLIAADLHVTVPDAGALVTVYALGLAVGGPVLAALTIRLDRKVVLVGTLALFVAANVVALLTADYAVFLVARILIGALQGLFIATSFIAGMSVVPPERMGKAIGIVVSGVVVSTALGVPLGTLVGQTLGWRGSSVAIVGITAVTLIATVALVPPVPPSGGGAGHQARYAFAPRVLAVLFLDFIVFATTFAALTYIVPFLQSVTGISGAMLSVFLLAYGVATAFGSFSGGRFADRDAGRTLVIGSLGIAFGAFAGGVAIDDHGASATVITGLIFAVLTVAVAWGTSFLKPPVVDEEPTTEAVPEPA